MSNAEQNGEVVGLVKPSHNPVQRCEAICTNVDLTDRKWNQASLHRHRAAGPSAG